MRGCGCGVHHMEGGIERAETHGASEMLHGNFGFAEPNPDPTAMGPCPCQARIKSERPIDKGGAIVEVPDYVGEGVSGPTQGKGIIFAKLNGPPRQAFGFDDGAVAVTL